MGHRVPGESLQCQPQWKDWVCESGSYSRSLSTPLTLRATAGFLTLTHGKGKREKAGSFRGEVTLVARGTKVALVNNVEMEAYLAGLVNSEIRSDYPREAVKAQVIAARSYALVTAAERRRAHEFFDLYGSEMDQVYQGSHREDARAYRIVRETKGQVLFHREDLVKAYYHSSSGGYSELPDNVWENAHLDPDRMVYLARPSTEDAEVKGTSWNVSLSPKIGLAWEGIGLIRDLKILERSSGQRVRKIQINGEQGSEIWTGTALRTKLGPRWLKSTLFTIARTAKGWRLEGRGFGHGVGMSQLGARQMARKGRSFREILNFYYPYSNIRDVNLESGSALSPKSLIAGPAKPAVKSYTLQAR